MVDGAGRWARLDSVLRTAEAADELARKGACEPALILYEELTRFGPREPSRGSLEERLQRARSSVAEWLHAELDGELARTLAMLDRSRTLFSLAALVLVLVLAVSTVLGPREIGEGAHWVVSSTWSDALSSGVLPEHGFFFSPPLYFFHTQAESAPSLTVDLGRERVVSAVELRNRLDCCEERARAARVELSRDGKAFVVVAGSEQHPSAFADWRAHFRAATVRYVRVVGTPNEPLHLSDVRIYGT